MLFIGWWRGRPTFCSPSESLQRMRKLNVWQGSGRDVLHAAHLSLLLLSLAVARTCACILLVHAYQACIGVSVYAQGNINDPG
jgi:hypothetical protein